MSKYLLTTLLCNFFFVSMLQGCTQSTPPNTPVEIKEPTRNLPGPVGLTGIVSTNNTVQLSWQMPAGELGLQFEVTRDGVLVDTTDNLEYIDIGVLPNTIYVYGVKSIDNSGNSSEMVTLQISTPAADPLINNGNAVRLLEQVIPAINGELFADMTGFATAAAAVGLAGDKATLLGFVELEVSATNESTTRLYGCELGGEWAVTTITGDSISISSKFSDCATSVFSGLTFNGQVNFNRADASRDAEQRTHNQLNLYNFTASSDAEARYLHGDISYFTGAQQHWSIAARNTLLLDENNVPVLDNDGKQQFVLEPFVYSVQPPDTSLEFFQNPNKNNGTRISINELSRTIDTNGEEIAQQSQRWENKLAVNMSLRSLDTNNRMVSIGTPTTLRAQNSAKCFSNGQFEIKSDDGSAVKARLDTEEPGSIDLTVSSEQSITNFSMQWTKELSAIHTAPLAIELDVIDNIRRLVAGPEPQAICN